MELIAEFYIDTDGYTDQDRAMFVAGFDFCKIVDRLRYEDGRSHLTIRSENASRARMAAAKFGRNVKIGVGTCPGYSCLEIEPK